MAYLNEYFAVLVAVRRNSARRNSHCLLCVIPYMILDLSQVPAA